MPLWAESYQSNLKDTLTQGGGLDMVLLGIALWVVLSFALAPVVGGLIAVGMGSDNERSDS